MPNRAQDWFAQAERDLAQADDSCQAARYEWACFAAQQAAEKAAKALHLAHAQEARGHVVAKLLKELPPSARAPDELVEGAHVLDSYYVPTRDPDSHSAGAPFEHYAALQANEAIKYAGEILAFVRAQMA